jgi:Ca2+-binding EF-hand superfamily protein
MEKLGNKVNEEELKEIFAHYDIDQTGDITF